MYRGLGNYDNAVFTAIGKAFTLMLLSVLWCICSVPVITAGAACSALYRAVSKSVVHDRGHAVQEYLCSFRENLKCGIILTLIIIGSLLAVIVDFYAGYVVWVTSSAAFIHYCAAGSAAFLELLILPYIFPCLSHFRDTTLGYIKRSCLLALGYFPASLFMAVLMLAGIYLTLTAPKLLFVIPGILCWIYSLIIDNIFKKLLLHHADKGRSQDTSWYLE